MKISPEWDPSRFLIKVDESLQSVVPIVFLVILFCLTITPLPTDQMLSFLMGGLLLVVGLGLFNFGAEKSMEPIGKAIGSQITRSRRAWVMLAVSFVLGLIVTVAEPDLQVLAGNVPHINSTVLILTISIGIGFFLMTAMLRIVLKIPLSVILIGCYGLIFVLAAFSDPNYLSVAFDAGGVTTGPMTAPFIIALGVGVAALRSDRRADEDSFGLVGICSIGPILMVLILGFFYPGESGEIAAAQIRSYADTVMLGKGYLASLPHFMYEVLIALLPILVFFLICQFTVLKIPRAPFLRIMMGILFTYVGLVCFLTGANVGFSSLAVLLGRSLANGWTRWILVPAAGLMGWFIVQAEPAVQVLTKQVEDISAGGISARSMRLSLSVAIALAAALSILRAFTGIHIFWFLIPGYAISLLLCFFVPHIFTAIAFDSGGVASGPLTATFMLPLAIGVCQAADGSLLMDAFGCVAMVSMMPLMTVQLLGLIHTLKSRTAAPASAQEADNTEVIELWEVA